MTEIQTNPKGIFQADFNTVTIDYMKELDSLIFKPEGYVVPKTDKIIHYMAEMANEIYLCPIRNRRKETREQKWRNVEKTALEWGLVLGWPDRFMKNPRGFDNTDFWSYGFDIVDLREVKVIECKHQLWGDRFTLIQDHGSTMLKNLDKIDVIITGHVNRYSDHWRVWYRSVIRAEVFNDYFFFERALDNGQNIFRFYHPKAIEHHNCVWHDS
ncbi:MAG: hypothetical protein ACWGQW_18510, partial [bacterium]